MTKSIYRAYALFMFHHLSQILKRGIGIRIDIYPSEDDKNTVIVVTFTTDGNDDVRIHEAKSLPKLLVIAGVEYIFSQLDGVKLEGTNTFVSSDRIVYIKENNVDLFSEDAVRINVMNLAKHRIGRA